MSTQNSPRNTTVTRNVDLACMYSNRTRTEHTSRNNGHRRVFSQEKPEDTKKVYPTIPRSIRASSNTKDENLKEYVLDNV